MLTGEAGPDLQQAARKCMEGYMRRNPEPVPGAPSCLRARFECVILPSPRLAHSEWDCGDSTGRAVEAWIRGRALTGDLTTGRDVEAGQRAFLTSILAPESGLVYVPENSNLRQGEYQFHLWDQGRTLRALVRWREAATGDVERRKVDGHLRTMVRGLRQLAQFGRHAKWGEYAIYTQERYRNRGPRPKGGGWTLRSGQLVEPLALHHQFTGDRDALEFALQLARGALSGLEDLDRGANAGAGRFGPNGEFNGHFHTHTSTVLGMARLGVGLIRDGRRAEGREWIHFSKRVYDWTLDPRLNLNAGGSWGWFPENVEARQLGPYSELCSVADMIELAAVLAACAPLDEEFRAYTALWDDVARFTRNGLLSRQFRDSHRLRALLDMPRPAAAPTASLLSRRSFAAFPLAALGRGGPGGVIESAEGGWIDACYANDLVTIDKDGLWLVPSGCCAYSGIRALDACWEGVQNRNGDAVEVNIPWTRSTAWVTAELRERGRVRRLRLAVHDARLVRVRIPEWQDGPVQVKVNTRNAPVRPESGYLSFAGLRKGDVVEIRLTARERVSRERVGAGNSGREMADPRLRGSYTVRWIGDRVVRLDPPGKHLPLFQS
jgi:hypothetical protein